MQITPSQYAALKGITPAAVSKAAKEGRLKHSITRSPNGRLQKIDVVMANKEWEANTDPSKVRGKNKPADEPVEATVAPPPPVQGNLELPFPPDPSISSSRNRLESYRAQLAKLDFDERSGRLVKADDVKDQAFKLARGLRDALMNIPDRLACELAGITDQHVIHTRISDEIRLALQDLITKEI